MKMQGLAALQLPGKCGQSGWYTVKVFCFFSSEKKEKKRGVYCADWAVWVDSAVGAGWVSYWAKPLDL